MGIYDPNILPFESIQYHSTHYNDSNWYIKHRKRIISDFDNRKIKDIKLDNSVLLNYTLMARYIGNELGDLIEAYKDKLFVAKSDNVAYSIAIDYSSTGVHFIIRLGNLSIYDKETRNLLENSKVSIPMLMNLNQCEYGVQFTISGKDSMWYTDILEILRILFERSKFIPITSNTNIANLFTNGIISLKYPEIKRLEKAVLITIDWGKRYLGHTGAMDVYAEELRMLILNTEDGLYKPNNKVYYFINYNREIGPVLKRDIIHSPRKLVQNIKASKKPVKTP